MRLFTITAFSFVVFILQGASTSQGKKLKVLPIPVLAPPNPNRLKTVELHEVTRMGYPPYFHSYRQSAVKAPKDVQSKDYEETYSQPEITGTAYQEDSKNNPSDNYNSFPKDDHGADYQESPKLKPSNAYDAFPQGDRGDEYSENPKHDSSSAYNYPRSDDRAEQENFDSSEGSYSDKETQSSTLQPKTAYFSNAEKTGYSYAALHPQGNYKYPGFNSREKDNAYIGNFDIRDSYSTEQPRYNYNPSLNEDIAPVHNIQPITYHQNYGKSTENINFTSPQVYRNNWEAPGRVHRVDRTKEGSERGLHEPLHQPDNYNHYESQFPEIPSYRTPPVPESVQSYVPSPPSLSAIPQERHVNPFQPYMARFMHYQKDEKNGNHYHVHNHHHHHNHNHGHQHKHNHGHKHGHVHGHKHGHKHGHHHGHKHGGGHGHDSYHHDYKHAQESEYKNLNGYNSYGSYPLPNHTPVYGAKYEPKAYIAFEKIREVPNSFEYLAVPVSNHGSYDSPNPIQPNHARLNLNPLPPVSAGSEPVKPDTPTGEKYSADLHTSPVHTNHIESANMHSNPQYSKVKQKGSVGMSNVFHHHIPLVLPHPPAPHPPAHHPPAHHPPSHHPPAHLHPPPHLQPPAHLHPPLYPYHNIHGNNAARNPVPNAIRNPLKMVNTYGRNFNPNVRHRNALQALHSSLHFRYWLGR